METPYCVLLANNAGPGCAQNFKEDLFDVQITIIEFRL